MIDVLITISGHVGSGKSITKQIIQKALEEKNLAILDYNVENDRETFIVQGEIKYGTTLQIIPNCSVDHNFQLVENNVKDFTLFCTKCGFKLTQTIHATA